MSKIYFGEIVQLHPKYSIFFSSDFIRAHNLQRMTCVEIRQYGEKGLKVIFYENDNLYQGICRKLFSPSREGSALKFVAAKLLKPMGAPSGQIVPLKWRKVKDKKNTFIILFPMDERQKIAYAILRIALQRMTPGLSVPIIPNVSRLRRDLKKEFSQINVEDIEAAFELLKSLLENF